MKPANMSPGGKTSASSVSQADMGWSSYIVPVAGSVIVSCLAFFLGKFNYSILWLGIIVVLNIVRSYLWKKRESRLLALRSTATREREVILAQLQDLPAWVQFPDTERVEWMNKVILQLWPYVGEYAKVFMTDFIIPQVKAQMPGMFKNFKFTKMDMGDLPCRVGGIKVYTHNVGRDRIIVDMEVAYAGDADFSVACCGFSGGMNNIVFSGKLRCVLKPLLPYPPMVGGVSASFLEMPKIDFNLTGMGEFVELPGLMNAIRSVINSQVAAIAVLPNEVVIPLAPDVDVTKLFFPEPDGVIRLKIIEAKQLENKDISFVRKGKSDPYCEIQVGSQFMKTRTIDNDLNPVWNEYFEAVVDQADGQKLRIELFDEDQGQDEELGRLSLDLSMIRSRGSVDKWFPLEGCKHGDLHIKATWMSLSTDLKYLDMRGAYEWLQADKPIHPALVMVFIDSVSELPYPKSKLEPSPYVEVTLGKESQRTPVKVKTVNPLYQTKLLFFVRNPEGQDLKLEAFDDGTKRGLGSLTIPLLQLMKEPGLEYYQSTFMLTHGVHQSPIVITCRLRVMAPTESSPEPKELAKEPVTVDETLIRKERNGLGSIRQRKALAQGVRDQNVHLDNDILKEYGNASHIERANSKTNGTVGNGDAHAVEPSKTVNPHAGALDPENKLTVDNFNILRSDSNISLNSGTQSGRSSRLGRMFKAKHEKDPRSRVEIPRGDMELSIRYADATQKLVVLILKARQLLPFDKKGACSPYTTVKLLDSKTGKEVAKRKTATIKNSLNPIYDNHFEFDVNASDLHNYKVQIDVKDDTNYGAFSSKPIVGSIGIRLDQLHEHQLPQQWVALQAERR